MTAAIMGMGVLRTVLVQVLVIVGMGMVMLMGVGMLVGMGNAVVGVFVGMRMLVVMGVTAGNMIVMQVHSIRSL